MSDIDRLEVQVEAQATKANNALDALVGRLDKISSSLTRIDADGLSNLANGVNRLTQASQGLKAVKLTDFTRLSKSLNALTGVDVQGVSDTSRAISTLTANLAQIDSVTVDSQGFANLANAVGSLGRKTVTQVVSNIPQLTKGIQGLVSGLNGIGTINFDMTGMANLVSSITKLGGKAATNAIPNIQQLGTVLKALMATLSTAPTVSQNLIDMTNAMANLASNGSRVSSVSTSLSRSFNTMSSSAKTAKTHSLGLASAIGKLYATYWIFFRAFGKLKDAIDISSDLTEVQNVVDVTFGKMKQKVEDLASVSITEFGMSELTAKQIASRFQAMGTAMGFTQEKMSDMSIGLTKLAADMASFYNVEQEAVAKSLQSVFAGETEPLRKYGIDLTNATLQEWAMKRGIDAKVASMTQAEKTLLRYQYVMESSSAAQGDFARTSGNWANQLRVLAQSFQALGAIVGEVLINVLKPFVQALNNVMQKVIQFARTVANALGKIFGWKFEISNAGITNDIDGIVAGTEETEDNLGGAADNAKKLRDYVLGIDELNIISPDDASGAADDMSSALDDLSDMDGAGDINLVKTESLFDKFKSDIDTLFELGRYISDALADMLESIDWDSIYQKAENFGKGLAQFLNGLITPRLFYDFGMTIANALNTVLHFLDAFGEEFNWINFGKSIAAGINGFFENFDFALLAKTINVWAKGLLDAIITAIDETDWGMIGTQIGTFLVGIDFLEIGLKIGKAIWKAINAGFELFEGMFEKAPLETALLSLVAITKLLKSNKVKAFASAIKTAVTNVTLFGKALTGGEAELAALTAAMPKTAKVIDVLKGSFLALKTGMADGGIYAGVQAAFEKISGSMTGLQKGVIGVVTAFAEFAIIKDSAKDIVQWLVDGTGNLGVNIAELAGAFAIAGVAFSTVFGFPAGVIAAGITALIAGIAGVVSAMNEMAENNAMETVANAMQNPGGVPISELSNGYVALADEIKAQFDGINQKSQELETTRANIAETTASLDPYVFAIQNGAAVTDESIAEMTAAFQRLLTDSSSLLEQESLIIYEALAGSLGEAVTAAGGSIDEYILATDRLKSETQKELEEISDSLGKLKEDYEQGILTQEEYAESMMDLISRYKELTGKGNEVESAISNLNDVVSAGINWDAVYKEGDFDSAALTNEIEKVGQSFTDAKDTVSTSGQEIIDTINSLIEQAQATGDTEAETALTQLLKYQEEEINRQIGEIDRLAAEYTQTIQDDLINKIPEIVDGVEPPNWAQALMGQTEESNVQKALSIFQEEWINPVESSIQEQFGTLGESGKTYASEAMGNILDGLFEYGNTNSANRYDQLRKTLTTDVEGAVKGGLDDAKAGIKTSADGLAKDTIDGYSEGIEAYGPETQIVLKTWMSDNVSAIHDSDMNFGSPSQTTYDFGQDTVEGFNLGIAENAASTTEVISAWMESVKQAFSSEQWTTMFANMLPAFQQKWLELTEWWNETAIPEFWEATTEGVFSLDNWLLLFDNMKLGMQTKWGEIFLWWTEEAMPVWWETGVDEYLNLERWLDELENVRLAFETKWTEIDQLIDLIMTEMMKKMEERMELIRTGWEEALSNMQETTTVVFGSVRDTAISILDEIIAKIAEVSSAVAGLAAEISGLSSSLSGLSGIRVNGISLVSGSVSGFASGGYPETGELFMARENGVNEMVGRIGSRNTVANNDQIVAGITAGVASANAEQNELLREQNQLLMAILEKGFNATLEIDGRELVSAYDRRAARNGFSFT